MVFFRLFLLCFENQKLDMTEVSVIKRLIKTEFIEKNKKTAMFYGKLRNLDNPKSTPYINYL